MDKTTDYALIHQGPCGTLGAYIIGDGTGSAPASTLSGSGSLSGAGIEFPGVALRGPGLIYQADGQT